MKTRTTTMVISAIVALLGIVSATGLATQAHATNSCSGNPHDFRSGPSGNPHDNEKKANPENGNPHDPNPRTDNHHDDTGACPGAK
jgi:hypothetical protein